ncbi:MAG: hypothetical protein M1832_000781 [Thelocarpon impressellum]|nr:MAG: hypothetical protein M1832_000781 [Thelocarpon impressellum]
MTTREATHAGSWYSAKPATLSAQLDGWLAQVPNSPDGVGTLPRSGARLIIAPHAGYSYSGPAAAWAYKSLDLSKVKRVFLLGPSHHVHLSGLALSAHASYDTPLGALRLDAPTIASLRATGKFEVMSTETDADEHSLEMHLPYIHKMLSLNFQDPKDFPPLTPLLVGATSAASERLYGEILAPHLADPSSVFVVSSDFCHWGSRFHYTFYLPSASAGSGYSLKPSARPPPTAPPIHESIAALDRLAMEAVSSGQHGAFLRALRETGNTVCGRHPIGVAMAAVEALEKDGKVGEGRGRFEFVRYERSSDVVDVGDSSVSYASAFAVL